MNKKYNYLIEYIKNNKDKLFEECEIFNTLKFNNIQNVDYIYFFVASDKRIEHLIDSEQVKSINSFTTNDYEEVQTNYPINTGDVYIPVISSSELPNKIVFRNVNKFYALQIARLPSNYWKLNPAINNYNTLIKNSINKNDIFEFINIDNITEDIFNDSTDYLVNNVDLKDTVLINTHTGKISNQTSFTDITWVDLELQEHNKAVREVVAGGSIEYPTADVQSKIYANKSIQKIINVRNNGAFTNTYAYTANTIYKPYVFDISDMDWYSWMNFINNQYDNGVLVTEYGKNIKNLYNIYEQKYIDTFLYPKVVFGNIPYYQMPNMVQIDPLWKDIVNKIEYLNTKCKQIGNYWYTKDTLLRVCCEHVRCDLMKTSYPKGLIIREEGQEICGNCCELIGNYNDDNAFIEGMTDMKVEENINYKWRNNQDDKSAELSWKNIQSYIEAIDPLFVENTTYVNKFIKMYHEKDYFKLFKKYSHSEFNYKLFIQDIHNVVRSMIVSRDINNYKNKFREIVCKYINNDYIINQIFKITQDNNLVKYLQENSTNINELQNAYYQISDKNIKSLLLIAISTCKIIDIITEKCSTYFAYELKTKQQLRLTVITNFLKNIVKKSERFIKLLSVCIVVVQIKCEASGLNEYSFDFNDINWNILFKNDNEINDQTIKDSQRDIILNLHSFENNPNGYFMCLYLNTNNIYQYLSNNTVVTWIINFFKTVSPKLKITVSLNGKKLEYNNSVLKYQQKIINGYYKLLTDKNLPILVNTNNLIVNKVIDSITCPDILTRKFESNKSFQELCKSQFPTVDEYFIDKQQNNIIFNEDTKLKQYYYMDIIKDIDETFIKPLENSLFNNVPVTEEIMQEPSTYFNNKIDQWFENIKDVTKTSSEFTDYVNLINQYTIPNTCKQVYEKLRDLANEIEIGINNVESLIEPLRLIPVNDKPVDNYKQIYNNVNRINRNQNQQNIINTYINIFANLIQWYMICIFAEDVISMNNVQCINKYNIIRNTIDNFHNYIFVNNIPYTLLKHKYTNDRNLIKQFIQEFFYYNNIPIDILQIFFKDLRINTQLFISPDAYIDSNIKIKRYIKRAKNLTDYLQNQEIDLQDLDEEEQGNERPTRKVDNDNIDYLHLPEIDLEQLTQNELIGGEIDDFTIDDEAMY